MSGYPMQARPWSQPPSRRAGAGLYLTLHQLFPSKEALEGALASGMEGGMRVTLDQLDELDASLH
jgi:hypothetical protein